MSKKYIYSEAKIIKEFLGNILTNIIANKNSNIVRDLIKKDPIVKQYSKDIGVAMDRAMKRIEQKRKNNPNYDKEIAQVDKYLDSL
jgi:hypothetical protein